MKKLRTFVAALLITVVLVAAGALGQKPRNLKDDLTLSDAFAKASLRALKAIDGDASLPELKNGQVLVNRHTQEMIDDADVEARNLSERAVVKLLNSLYLQHLTNNLDRETVTTQYKLKVGTGRTSDLDAGQLAAKDPDLQRKLRSEEACSTALDDMLRSRAFAMLESCSQSAQPTQQAEIAPANNSQVSRPPQKKVVKDPTEYNAYVNAVQFRDPIAKANSLEAFVQTYPNSVMKEDALEVLMASYEQSSNTGKMVESANRVLQVNPENIRALALLAFNYRRMAEAGQNPQGSLAQGAQYAERGLRALQTSQRPDSMSDTDFEKLKTQTSVIFNGVAGIEALQTRDYASAQERLQNSVNSNPNNVRDVYPLALAYLTAPQPDYPKGLWYIARAVNLSHGSPAQSQIAEYGRKQYASFYGSDRGWKDLLSRAQMPTERLSP